MKKVVRRWLLAIIWLGFAAYPVVTGWSYYITPLSARPEHPLHALYRPTGMVGHGLGIVGTLMIILGVGLYMIRKRWHALHRWGRLSSWLTFHIFMCTLGPFFVVLHTTFKVGNIVSIAFWSMIVVVISGIFGRYVHAHIPKFEDGHFFTEGDIRRAQKQIVRHIASQTGLPEEALERILQRHTPHMRINAFFQALAFAFRSDFLQRTYTRHVLQELLRTHTGTASLEAIRPHVERYIRLSLQEAVLFPLQKAFGYWHTLHFPLAATMFLILFIHVGVAIAFGYTWIF